MIRAFDGYRHGVNLGGWLSQCGQPDREHAETFITGEDLKAIAGMGLDHVRLPVDYFFLETDGGERVDIGPRAIDTCVERCEKLGLNVLLDLHKAYGYTFDPMDPGADRAAFFHRADLQERFIALWRYLAERYGRCPNIAFDLLNEVVLPEVAAPWNDIARRAIRAIHEIAPNVFTVVGGTRYNAVKSVPELDARVDDKVVYNFHCYEPLVFTHQGAYWVRNMPAELRLDYPGDPAAYEAAARALDPELAAGGSPAELGPDYFERLFAPALKHAEKSGVPLYCGEYGVIDRADPEAALRWLKDIAGVFDRRGIGRALWTYKQMDFGLTDPHYAPIRDRMIGLL